jgi:hypothetical protein
MMTLYVSIFLVLQTTRVKMQTDILLTAKYNSQHQSDFQKP